MNFLRSKRQSLGLDMAPLIDIVFLLLIFFMLSSSFLKPALKLDLPESAPHDIREMQQVLVSIDKDGKVFVNAKASSMQELKRDLTNALEEDPDRAIHLQGDKNMPYQYFVQAMDQARGAGATTIHVVHETE